MKHSIIIGIIILILFFPFYINIKIEKINKINTAKIGIGIFYNKLRLFYKIKPNKIKRKSRTKIDKNYMNFFKKKYVDHFNKKNNNRLIVFFKYLFNYIKVKELIVETRFGLIDAAQTAIVTGIIFSIKSFFIAYITSKMNIEKIKINVSPIFSINTAEIYFSCIIKYKLVYIIIAGLNSIIVRKKVVD